MDERDLAPLRTTASGESEPDGLGAGRYFFDLLDKQVKDEAFERGNVRNYSNGDYLIRQGSKADGVHIILRGGVESIFESKLSRELILATWEAGDFVGGPYVIGDHEQIWSARAVGPVTALHIDQRSLMVFAAEVPAFALAMIECLGFKGERYSRLAQVLATHTTIERLSLLLLELAQQAAGVDDDPVRIAIIKQSKLANMIGATRQSVGLALKRLEDAAVIRLEPANIVILDRGVLGEFGNADRN